MKDFRDMKDSRITINNRGIQGILLNIAIIMITRESHTHLLAIKKLLIITIKTTTITDISKRGLHQDIKEEEMIVIDLIINITSINAVQIIACPPEPTKYVLT